MEIHHGSCPGQGTLCGIGTYGASALGITQNVLANLAPDGLVCQVVAVAPSNFYSQSTYQGNALRLSLNVGWLLMQSANDAIKANASGNPATATAFENFFDNRYDWYEHLPLKNFPTFNRVMPTFDLTISNPDYSEESWGSLNEEAHQSNIPLPVYNIGGWYRLMSSSSCLKVSRNFESLIVPNGQVKAAATGCTVERAACGASD